MCRHTSHHKHEEVNVKLLYEILLSLRSIEECLEDMREHFEHWEELCGHEEEEDEEYCDECGQEEEEIGEESCRC